MPKQCGNLPDRVPFVNDRMARTPGRSPGEMVGRLKWDFLFDEEREFVRALFERRRSGVSEQADVRFRHRDGRAIGFMMSARPVFDEAGGFRGCLDIFTDVTERKRAEAAVRDNQAFSRSVLDSLPAQVAVLDTGGAIIAVNATPEGFGEDNGADSRRCVVGTNYLDAWLLDRRPVRRRGPGSRAGTPRRAGRGRGSIRDRIPLPLPDP